MLNQYLGACRGTRKSQYENYVLQSAKDAMHGTAVGRHYQYLSTFLLILLVKSWETEISLAEAEQSLEGLRLDMPRELQNDGRLELTFLTLTSAETPYP